MLNPNSYMTYQRARLVFIVAKCDAINRMKIASHANDSIAVSAHRQDAVHAVKAMKALDLLYGVQS